MTSRHVIRSAAALAAMAVTSLLVAGNEPGCGGGCFGDLNYDSTVDAADLNDILGNFGSPGCGDMNDDDIVDAFDLALFLSVWGPCEGGACPAGPDGDCCSAHFGPGCSDSICCGAICALDSYCCDATWDALCVTQAQANSACACVAP